MKTIKEENFFDEFFDCELENGRVVLNSDRKVVFDFNNGLMKNYIVFNDFKYKIICIEQNDKSLLFYGRNIDVSESEVSQIIKIVICDNNVNIITLKESELEPFF